MCEIPATRILVVDDEEVVRALCTRILKPLGYTIDVAVDGQQALEQLQARSFHLVITDFRMPGSLDGLALATAVKELSPETRIIFMTAFPDVEATVGMMRIGACDCLIKPFNQVELVRSVASCLSKNRPV